MSNKKILTDMTWSYLAFAVMAGSGVAVNLVLALSEGPEAMGVFNQTMAFYVIASHFAVFGIHNATLFYAAAYPRWSAAAFRNALFPLLFIASAVTAVLLFYADDIGNLYGSEVLSRSLHYAGLALLFFAFNKVGLAYLNGMQQMKLYALALSMRYLAIFLVVLYICMTNLELGYLGASFLVAEVLVSVFLVSVLSRECCESQPQPSKKGLRKLILRFSYRSAGAGLLNEMNLRVDILVLGLFMSDSEVGIYSFAALFMEGFYNVGLAVRNVINPYIVKAFRYRSFDSFSPWCRKLNVFSVAVSIIISVAGLCLYDPIIVQVLGMDEFAGAKQIVAIMFLFMGIYFIFVPYEEVVLVSGNPLRHTQIYCAVVASNIALNFLLIPDFGLVGAAVSTGVALWLMLISVSIYSRMRFGVNLCTGNISR